MNLMWRFYEVFWPHYAHACVTNEWHDVGNCRHPLTKGCDFQSRLYNFCSSALTAIFFNRGPAEIFQIKGGQAYLFGGHNLFPPLCVEISFTWTLRAHFYQILAVF